MTTKTYTYDCNECDNHVETEQFREARECPECEIGMLVVQHED